MSRDASPSASSSADSSPRARELLKIWAPVTLLALLAFGITIAKLDEQAPDRLVIATGSPQGAYQAFAERYREALAEIGYELEIRPTAGSIENLGLLAAGEVDIALVQGGTADAAKVDLAGLEALGSVFLEPVWLFHRADLTFDYLSQLDGRRIAIGPEGSGSRSLAFDLLAENAIDAESAELLPLGSDDAVTALLDGTIDAAFFVASASSPYIERLLAAEGVTLFPFRRQHAYKVRHPFLSPVVLGEGVVDLDDNLPARDVPMVAAAASLVARQGLHYALLPPMIEALESVHGLGGIFEAPGTFPSQRFVDLPMRKEATHYLENGPSFLYRLFPGNPRLAAEIDRLKILLLPFIPLLLVVFKMAPPLYRWSIRSKIYRWYDDLRKLDLLVLQGPSPEALRDALATLDRVELEVTEVQVPLSYMDEFYNLRVHIELIEKKLLELRRAQAEDEAQGS